MSIMFKLEVFGNNSFWLAFELLSFSASTRYSQDSELPVSGSQWWHGHLIKADLNCSFSFEKLMYHHDRQGNGLLLCADWGNLFTHSALLFVHPTRQAETLACSNGTKWFSVRLQISAVHWSLLFLICNSRVKTCTVTTRWQTISS